MVDFVNFMQDKYFEKWKAHRPNLKPKFSVFYTRTIDLETFVDHIQNTCNQIETFNFTVRCAITQISDIAGCTVDLVADEGLQNFLKLSSELDNGELSTHYHPANYVPGLIVGWILGLEEANEICRQINKTPFEFSGKITSLTVQESTGEGFKDAYTFNLK